MYFLTYYCIPTVRKHRFQQCTYTYHGTAIRCTINNCPTTFDLRNYSSPFVRNVLAHPFRQLHSCMLMKRAREPGNASLRLPREASTTTGGGGETELDVAKAESTPPKKFVEPRIAQRQASHAYSSPYRR